MRATHFLALLLGIGVLAWWTTNGPDEPVETVPSGTGTALVDVVIPEEFSANAQTGKTIYEAKCAVCHAVNAVGQAGVAPPLVHKIYEPSHHADEAFQRAVALGVRQHHWTFGDMPPIEGLTRGDVTLVVTYIRELQRTNGIN